MIYVCVCARVCMPSRILTWIISVEAHNGVSAVGHRDGVFQGRSFEFPIYQSLPLHFLYFVDSNVVPDSFHGYYAELIAVKVKRMIRIERETCEQLRSLTAVRSEASPCDDVVHS